MYHFRALCAYDKNNHRCVEIATNVPGMVALRDQKGNKVEYTADEWTAFTERVKMGEVDPLREI